MLPAKFQKNWIFSFWYSENKETLAKFKFKMVWFCLFIWTMRIFFNEYLEKPFFFWNLESWKFQVGFHQKKHYFHPRIERMNLFWPKLVFPQRNKKPSTQTFKLKLLIVKPKTEMMFSICVYFVIMRRHDYSYVDQSTSLEVNFMVSLYYTQ